jgi:hypothetical protein
MKNEVDLTMKKMTFKPLVLFPSTLGHITVRVNKHAIAMHEIMVEFTLKAILVLSKNHEKIMHIGMHNAELN